MIIKELYYKNFVSPYNYFYFAQGSTGVMPFYFRGKNSRSAMKSLAMNHHRLSNKMKYSHGIGILNLFGDLYYSLRSFSY